MSLLRASDTKVHQDSTDPANSNPTILEIGLTAFLIRLLIFLHFSLIVVLKQLEKFHVEHAEHPVQCAHRGRVGRALQDDLRIWLRLLENGHFSFFRRGVSRCFALIQLKYWPFEK